MVASFTFGLHPLPRLWGAFVARMSQGSPWEREAASALEPYSYRGGGYLNYMAADEPVERVRAAYGEKIFERLQTLKRRYDPENVFRLNQNIPPA